MGPSLGARSLDAKPPGVNAGKRNVLFERC
jgi:hypothetical protein